MPDADFRLQYTYAVPAARLYETLATQAGIRKWWTDTCQVSSKVGGKALFLFPGADFYAVMKILTLRPPALIEWECVDCKHPDTAQYIDLHDWIGTTVRFEIAALSPGKSQLTFTHVGLVPLECGETCSSIWSFYLGQSLRQYFETGTGQPSRPDPA